MGKGKGHLAEHGGEQQQQEGETAAVDPPVTRCSRCNRCVGPTETPAIALNCRTWWGGG